MKVVDYGEVTLYDLESPLDDFRADVLHGLSQPAKTLLPKYFYDDTGARLFEQISELPEYYPTRTEIGILRERAGEIGELLGIGCMLVEFGSGEATKIRILLDHLQEPAAYVPIDVAKTQLVEVAARLVKAYPGLEILPVCADYMGALELPVPRASVARTSGFFPGSTIGNLERADAAHFLLRVARLCGAGGYLVVGVDLRKDPSILIPAYNDAAGVTAAFNLNLLARINRELDGDFELGAFRHEAVWDDAQSRIEMHLVSLKQQTVHIGDAAFAFAEGEPIVTEYSHKYSPESFRELAADAGFSVERFWSDQANLFSVQMLRVVRDLSER
jgi:dimethylhistidine N-methyltransferase